MTGGGGRAPGAAVRHGFPHLATVRAAITALYRALPGGPGAQEAELRRIGAGVAPVDVAFDDAEDPHEGAQRVARALLAHFGLPDARVVARFHEMDDAADVERAADGTYTVRLNTRFLRHRRDIGAALAHEVAHVYLHRLGLAFRTVHDNEILTDTVATYLGAGWLLLDAFRQDALTSQKLGYLTPEEYGYVLARRAALLGEDPAAWFTSPQAYEAYTRGREVADADARRAPLAAAGRQERWRYALERRRAGHRAAGRASPGGGGYGYAFEPGPPLRVSFPCPVCGQRLRVPVRGVLRARCGLCRTVLECDT